MKLIEISIGKEDYNRTTAARIALLGLELEVGFAMVVGWYVEIAWIWSRRTFYLDGMFPKR